MEFEEYFKEQEQNLIKVIGEKNWFNDKVYFVEEIIQLVNNWQDEYPKNNVGSIVPHLAKRCKKCKTITPHKEVCLTCGNDR